MAGVGDKSHHRAHGWVVCIGIWMIGQIGAVRSQSGVSMKTLVVGRNFAENLVIGSTRTVNNNLGSKVCQEKKVI